MDEPPPPPPLKWSGTFALLPSNQQNRRTLSGDKVNLPSSALEQLLAASSSRFTSVTPSASAISFPESAARNDKRYELPQPLTFRLTNSLNDRAVYGGVREFTAPEGSIELSDFLLRALDLDERFLDAQSHSKRDDDTRQGSVRPGPIQITIHNQQLPKGTSARLRPLEAGYNPDDWRPLLERHFRESFTCLTRNCVLSVRGVHDEVFEFLLDRLSPPGDGVCVVDTDLEVDMEPLNEEQARETLRQLLAQSQLDNSSGNTRAELSTWKDVSGQVSNGNYVDYVLPSWDRSRPLKITLSHIDPEDGLDLFVSPKTTRQRSLPRQTNHVFGNFSSALLGAKSITIPALGVSTPEAEAILISVHAYPSDASSKEALPFRSYRLRAQAATVEANDDAPSTPPTQPSLAAGEEQCSSCLQSVPKQTMVLHANFCRRNNVRCPKCDSVFKIGSSEWESHWHCEHDSAFGNSALSKTKHDNIFHKHRQCPSCPFSTSSASDLARHRTGLCPGKMILCRFCHLDVPQGGDPFNPAPEVILSGMTSHELSDGARTTECHLCGKFVRLRDMETHIKHHELDKAGRSRPVVCRNANCARTLRGSVRKGENGFDVSEQGSQANELGICSLCFGPLYVSMHDPDGKALKRRVERRYLSQMMTGCQKGYCSNEWCKTGRVNAGLDEKGSSTKVILPLVEPLVARILDQNKPLFFCVDEANQTRRKAANTVAEEKTWDVAWCIAAAESEKGDLARMREWLQAWAPRR